MRFTEVDYNDAVPIDGYGPGFFRIGGKVVEGPVTVLPSGVAGWAGFDAVDDLLAAARGQVDVLLVGTGAETAHPPAAFRQALEAAGIGIEPMATASACRTFNVLLGEGRRVGAALLPV